MRDLLKFSAPFRTSKSHPPGYWFTRWTTDFLLIEVSRNQFFLLYCYCSLYVYLLSPSSPLHSQWNLCRVAEKAMANFFICMWGRCIWLTFQEFSLGWLLLHPISEWSVWTVFSRCDKKEANSFCTFLSQSSTLQRKDEKRGPLVCFPPALPGGSADLLLFILYMLGAPPVCSLYVLDQGKRHPAPPGHVLFAVTNQFKWQ